MSRHFYDLEKLSHTDYMDKALNDSTLYHDIVEHRKKFYHVGYVDYDKELPESITIVPSEELVPKYEVDYNDMRSSRLIGAIQVFPTIRERCSATNSLGLQCLSQQIAWLWQTPEE